MKIALVLFLFVDFVNITMCMFPCRDQIISIYRLGYKKGAFFWVTLLVIFASFTIIVISPEVMSLFGLSGGIFCTIIGWTVPYLLMIRIYGKLTGYFDNRIEENFCSLNKLNLGLMGVLSL